MKRDHDILHMWANNLATATVQHPIVKMGLYGIPHSVQYEQDTLTLAQVKDMHDEWVKKYDPISHDTPINAPSTAEVKHASRWDDVVIHNKETNETLTKRDIYRYYSSENVKKTLFAQIKDSPVMMRQAMDPSDSWIKRNPVIRKNVNDAADPEDLQFYIERRHVEFHPTMQDSTDKLVIDVDPGRNVTLDETKKVVTYLEKLLENQPFISSVEIQYSGNRGFYVWGYLSAKQPIDTVREKLKKLLNPIKTMNGVKTVLRAKPGAKTVRLDLSPMKHLGTVKAEGSLDFRTGYVSTKVLPSKLQSFTPSRDATINKSKLKPVYSFKDETLV